MGGVCFPNSMKLKEIILTPEFWNRLTKTQGNIELF